MWRRWIYDDYYRSYLIPLEKYGLKIPLVEKTGTASGTGVTCIRWPSSSPRLAGQLLAYRPDDRRRLQWFEHKYRAGTTSSASGGSTTARSRTNTTDRLQDTGYVYPHRCWTCMVPCLIREDIVMDEVDGQVRTYCSEPATGPTRWRSGAPMRPRDARHGATPANVVGDPLHGLADIQKDLGYVRDDGKTLVQPPSSTTRRCGRLTTRAGSSSRANVLLNQMTPAAGRAYGGVSQGLCHQVNRSGRFGKEQSGCSFPTARQHGQEG